MTLLLIPSPYDSSTHTLFVSTPFCDSRVKTGFNSFQVLQRILTSVSTSHPSTFILRVQGPPPDSNQWQTCIYSNGFPTHIRLLSLSGPELAPVGWSLSGTLLYPGRVRWTLLVIHSVFPLHSFSRLRDYFHKVFLFMGGSSPCTKTKLRGLSEVKMESQSVSGYPH